MNVTLTPELVTMIREKVESGLYNNSSEVVREALRLMERQDREDRLRAALTVGMAEIDRGEGVEYTPQVLKEIDREADRMLAEGVAPDPDVWP